jgi:hypothetical protein
LLGVSVTSFLVALLLCQNAPAGPEQPSANIPQPGTDKPGVDLREAPKAPAVDLQGEVEDGTPIRSWQEKGGDEAKAYSRTLLAAHTNSPEALANSARRDVKFIHLFEEPAKFRGQVIHVEGRLKRVTRYDPPTTLKTTFDIQNLYEGWIFDPEISGANPMCLIFTDLPPGLTAQEKMEARVGFDGYFFKKYRYKSGDGWRDAPLLIGHTLTLHALPPSEPAPDDPFAKNLIIIFMSILVATFILGYGLTWWYRRGDRLVEAAKAKAFQNTFQEPSVPAAAEGLESNSGTFVPEDH